MEISITNISDHCGMCFEAKSHLLLAHVRGGVSQGSWGRGKNVCQEVWSRVGVWLGYKSRGLSQHGRQSFEYGRCSKYNMGFTHSLSANVWSPYQTPGNQASEHCIGQTVLPGGLSVTDANSVPLCSEATWVLKGVPVLQPFLHQVWARVCVVPANLFNNT